MSDLMEVNSKKSQLMPCGGELINLIVPEEEREELFNYANTLQTIQLDERAACDLELLATGAFSPLNGFMNRADYKNVLNEMRLADGHIFPIPVTLSVESVETIKQGQTVSLRNAGNEILALLEVEEIYEWQRDELAQKVFGTEDLRHPIVAEMYRWGRFNLSGNLRVLSLPKHYDFQDLRLTPKQTRERLGEIGNSNVVAFQTRNPLHRAHEEMTKRAIEIIDGTLLLHPVVGMTKAGDVDYFTRVRTYKTLAQKYYEQDKILLSLLPLAMRMAGPREALWHALIRRNYGANHLIIGRDHASPGVDSNGKPFYSPNAAQELAEQYSDELGVKILSFDEMVYLPTENRYEETSRVSADISVKSLSGTQVRNEYLNRGRELPDWFTRNEVAEILSATYPPRNKQGVCLWFTGLSGAGKSTTAEILTVLLLEHGRQSTVLDGDVVRTNLSKGLGFSKEDRDTNITRIGFVASEIVRHGGVVVCAAVSPYRATRNDVRSMFDKEKFVEVFVSTPLEVCEERDLKGMYAKARRGEIKNFTGIDDPYEPPLHAEIQIDTVNNTAEENAQLILRFLIEKGFVSQQK